MSKKICELIDVTRTNSLRVMQNHCQLQNIELVDFNKVFSFYGHWMTYIQLTTSFFRIVFKNYFYSDDAKAFLEKIII